MSKKSLKKQEAKSKNEDSEGEDEEDLHAAIREMFRTSDIDVRPSMSSRYSEEPEEEKPKNLTEQGSQTDGSSLKKPKTSKPENKKLESEDSWAAIFIKRFSWTKTPKTEAVPPEGNQTQPATNVSVRKGTENRSNFSKGETQGAKSSTETSNESLLRTDYYHLSLGKSEESKSLKNKLNDEGSGEESSEFLEKLRKIEEASKPKTWKRPQPIVIKPNTNSPTTKTNKDAVEARPQKDADEKHRYINILKVPFQRDLNYAAENEPNVQTTVNQQPTEKDTQPESRNQKSESETIAEESSGSLTENPAEKREEKPAVNAEKGNADNADSQRTFTITGHSHITAKWGKHCHFREKDTGVDKKARRILIIACILCSTFMIIEIVGGIVSNSLAIATDAAHLLTDLASFLISLFALYLAGRPSSERLNFGWYRAEVIGAMISVFFIWASLCIWPLYVGLTKISNWMPR
ncbi:uncharacterized protein LOC108104117 [Drosophila eugracilis]|uniref:uncharacterized protein LOC108104117 n=1 Tax=Drosophila eugracilis TaxID=29029 RepID=UPI001BDAACE0|nr:uncharacterized protein LOC108104117 [Drosophila eugracilis]